MAGSWTRGITMLAVCAPLVLIAAMVFVVGVVALMLPTGRREYAIELMTAATALMRVMCAWGYSDRDFQARR